MATELQIINAALTKLGKRQITQAELTAGTVEEARRASAAWDIAREAVLRDHAWGFANVSAALVDSEETVLGYSYIYTYPTDCLAVRKVFNAALSDPQPYRKYMIPDESTPVIVIACNVEDAYLEYTADVDDVSLFDAGFCDAMAWRLAAELAIPLTGDASKGDGMMRGYMLSLDIAKTADAKEQYQAPNSEDGNPYYEAR